tara:strand:+ start:628 stop:1275 length:648 start_codon:yes stop_codon:yes gene_type:complete
MDSLNMEKLFEFLKKNFLSLFLGIILIVSSLIFYVIYSTNQKNKTYASQELYESYLNKFSTYDASELNNLEIKLNELKNNNPNSIYYYLANFYQVKVYFENDEELKALDLMQELNLTLEGENFKKYFLRDLSRIRLASIFIDFERTEEAREILEKSFNFYEALRLEKLGDLEKSIFNYKMAQNYYEMAIQESDNQTQINMLNFKLSSLASASNEN